MKFNRFIDPGGSQEPPAIAPGVAVRASMEIVMKDENGIDVSKLTPNGLAAYEKLKRASLDRESELKRESEIAALIEEIDLSEWEWGDISVEWTLRKACEEGAKVMLSEMSKDVHLSLELDAEGGPTVEFSGSYSGVVYLKMPFAALFAERLPVLLDDDWHEDYREDVVSVLAILNKYKELFEAGLAKMDSRKGV